MSVTLTESAVKELKRVLEDKDLNLDEVCLRVGVQGGGCAGFQYALNFDDQENIDETKDSVQDIDGIKLVVDKKSMLFLDGTSVDWIEDLQKRGFAFNNPNATSSCGCNQSFSA